MNGKARAELRAEAHHLSPMLHIGQLGLTDTALNALDDALRTHELVKVAISRAVDAPPKDIASRIAESLGAEVIQTIGRKITLYRFNPELHAAPNQPPPWRR